MCASDEDAKTTEPAADKGLAPSTSSAKAKRKALLAKANAEGAKGDILDAFVTPSPAQPEVVKEPAPEASPSEPPADQPPPGHPAQESGQPDTQTVRFSVPHLWTLECPKCFILRRILRIIMTC